jgi:cyclin H
VACRHLATSRLTDAEFLYSPSQISLACFRLADEELVDSFLDWRYTQGQSEDDLAYGIAKDRLIELIQNIQTLIMDGAEELDLKRIKGIDKRLKSCTNPEKVPGTAL